MRHVYFYPYGLCLRLSGRVCVDFVRCVTSFNPPTTPRWGYLSQGDTQPAGFRRGLLPSRLQPTKPVIEAGIPAIQIALQSGASPGTKRMNRSEEHTSELQS